MPRMQRKRKRSLANDNTRKCICCGCNLPLGSAIDYCDWCNNDHCLDENGDPTHE